MTNIAPTGRTITPILKQETIRDGGIEIVTLPTLNVQLSNEHESMKVEFCGYPSLVNYNKHREIQHKKEKEQKRFRSLKRQIKIKEVVKSGLELPSLETLYLNSSRGLGS